MILHGAKKDYPMNCVKNFSGIPHIYIHEIHTFNLFKDTTI